MIQATSGQLRITQIDDRPTICHVIHALGVGGAEVLVDQMVRRLSDEFHCVAAVLDETGEIGERLLQDGFTVEFLGRRPGIDRNCAKRLKAFADREGAGILHAHQYTPFFQCLLSRGLLGRRPIVFTEHGRHFPDLPSRKRSVVNRLLLRKNDRLFGCGEAVRRALIENEGLPASRVDVIYNGVDLRCLRSPALDARQRIRQELGCRSEDFVAIIVARLHPLKDHLTALRAVDSARMQIPNLRLLIVGEGDQRPVIEQAIRELDLQRHVILTGSRNDVADLLSASDVFLLTSLSEGIPLTVIEAMAARRPVVATTAGGLPELVTHGASGLLSPVGDSDDLGRSLVRLFSDPGLQNQLAENAAMRAAEKFSLDAMLNQYRCVYREILSGNCETGSAAPASELRRSASAAGGGR